MSALFNGEPPEGYREFVILTAARFDSLRAAFISKWQADPTYLKFGLRDITSCLHGQTETLHDQVRVAIQRDGHVTKHVTLVLRVLHVCAP